MKFLFIPSFLESNYEGLKSLSFILVIFYAAVLVAIFVDLVSGVDRAKREGMKRCSDGFKRTIYKIKDYYSMLLLFTIIDVVASIWFTLPFFTAVGTIAIIFVEGKSVYENKRGLNKGIRDLPDALRQILKSKDKADELLNFLESKGQKKRHEDERSNSNFD